MVEPRLVNVDDSRTLVHLLEHELAVLLSEDETSLGIALEGN